MSPPDERTARPPAAPPRPRRHRALLRHVALALVIAAAALFLLQQLAALLKPLFLAVFLAYIILPAYFRLRRHGLPIIPAVAVLAGASVGILLVVATAVYASAQELLENLEPYGQKASALAGQLWQHLGARLPWLEQIDPGAGARPVSLSQVQAGVAGVAGLAADFISQAAVVGLYLLFLLLEAPRFPKRLTAAFPGERGERLLAHVERINAAMAGYLKLKAKASLLLAVPFVLTLWACGVRFALFWGVLAFACNFIPYIGAFVSTGLAVLFAFVQLGLGWPAWVVLGTLTALQLLLGSYVEPWMTGRAVNLSPLVVLVALAFWGLCWGLIGALLAVPLTVVLKLVLENMDATRPYARLLAAE